MVFQKDYCQGFNILDDLYSNRAPDPEFKIFPSPGWGTPPDPHRRLDRLSVAQYSHAYLITSSGANLPPTRTNEKLTEELTGEDEVEGGVKGNDVGVSAFRRTLQVLERLKESSEVLEGLLREKIGEEEKVRRLVGEVDRLVGRLGEWREKNS